MSVIVCDIVVAWSSCLNTPQKSAQKETLPAEALLVDLEGQSLPGGVSLGLQSSRGLVVLRVEVVVDAAAEAASASLRRPGVLLGDGVAAHREYLLVEGRARQQIHDLEAAKGPGRRHLSKKKTMLSFWHLFILQSQFSQNLVP